VHKAYILQNIYKPKFRLLFSNTIKKKLQSFIVVILYWDRMSKHYYSTPKIRKIRFWVTMTTILDTFATTWCTRTTCTILIVITWSLHNGSPCFRFHTHICVHKLRVNNTLMAYIKEDFENNKFMLKDDS